MRWRALAGFFAACGFLAAQHAVTIVDEKQGLAGWAAALGGRDRVEQVRTLHFSGSVETGGLKGKFERWSTSSGQYRMALELGAIHQEVIFDGKQGWSRDFSGAVHELGAGTLRSTVSSAYEASNSHLFPGRLPGHARYVGQEAGTQVLSLEADGGAPVTVYLDDKTMLPLKEVTSDALGKTRTIAFESWREFGGVRVPVRIRQSNGDPKYDMMITTEHVEVNESLAAGLFSKPGDGGSAIQFPAEQRSIVIPVEVYAQHVFVPMRISGGEAAWFFLDTGAGTSVVTKVWAERIGLKTEGSLKAVGAAGSQGIAMARNVLLGLPGLDVPLAVIGVLDAARVPGMFGRRWEGALGYDFLSRVVVKVDYEHSQMIVTDPAAFTPDQNAVALHVTFLGNWPLVAAKILLPGRKPVEVKCFIDSGAGGLILATPFVKSNRVMDVVKKRVEGAVYGVGGVSKHYFGRIAGIDLGGLVVRGPVAGFSEDTSEGALSTEIGAMIGGEILQRFTVTIDYPHGRIWLEPNSRFAEPFHPNESGLSLIASGPGFHRFECDRVESGSPAERAGMRKNDVLAAIDRHPATELNLDQVDHLLAQPGRTVLLTIERDGRTIPVKLALRERL